MSMHYANNEQNQLIHISQSERGLDCKCTCFVCGEQVKARKGKINQHHFAHHLPKEDCKIEPESALHKYAKEVIQKNLSITVPMNQEWNNSNDKNIIEFSNVITEKAINSIRPDITGFVEKMGKNVYLEVVVTNAPDEEKLKIIQELKLDTVQIDLQEILTKNIHFPSKRAEYFILGAVHNKKWLFPNDLSSSSSTVINDEPLNEIIPLEQQKPKFTKFSFKISGIWVNVIQFEDQNIAITFTYNPELVDIFKDLRKNFRGFYNNKYHSSNFRYPYSLEVIRLLSHLDEQ